MNPWTIVLAFVLSAQGPQVPVQADASLLETRVAELERRAERSEGAAEMFARQLEVERAMNERAIDAIERIATIYTGAVAAVVLILGLFGYRDLRETVRRTVHDQIDQRLTELLSGPIDKQIKDHLHKWDAKHAAVLKRIEKVGRGREELSDV